MSNHATPSIANLAIVENTLERNPKTGMAALFSAPLTFGKAFLSDHAGAIVADARTAIIELIANAYDAGATEVRVNWPDKLDGDFSIEDNGTGMNPEEFSRRWAMLSYNRTLEQGRQVVFPGRVQPPQKRIAFGQNGKGRHAPFCFADAYRVITSDGRATTDAKVIRDSVEELPFIIELQSSKRKRAQGTSISCKVTRNHLSPSYIREAIGSKFLVDPTFRIIFNAKHLELEELGSKETFNIDVKEYGRVQIHQIDGQARDRTTRLRGITYWVNKRQVRESSWDDIQADINILDGRSSAAKRYSFVVEADLLHEDVASDWSGFKDTPRVREVTSVVRDEVVRLLKGLMAGTMKERKQAALAPHREVLRALTPVSRKAVGEFIDAIQERCPTVSEDVLAKTVEVYANMEQARSGHELLKRLAECSPDDIDRWAEIMENWTAQDAKHVLDELGRRLNIISQLEKLVNDRMTDELHDLQPLFQAGLWIFGPEYERVDFTSNKALATVIRNLLGGQSAEIDRPRRRPDFVALPDRSIGVYSSDAWDQEGESYGIDKVLIVELKRGGFVITRDEMRQGQDYAIELRKGNKVGPQTHITVFVLGASLGQDARNDLKDGDYTTVKPLIYDSFIKRAHRRTFNLMERVSEASRALLTDEDIAKVLEQGVLEEQERTNHSELTEV